MRSDSSHGFEIRRLQRHFAPEFRADLDAGSTHCREARNIASHVSADEIRINWAER